MGVANLPDRLRSPVQGNHGAPNLGMILEYDALRGTKGAFHGDQHSAQGPVGIAAAVADGRILERTHTPGSVVVFGTPGEEMMPPVAKTDMFKAGVFNGMDVIVRSHAVSSTNRPAPGFGTCCLNIDGVKYTFSRRARAPDDAMGRPQRAGRRHPPVQQHRCRAHHHAPRGAHSGRHHRRRRRSERSARPHRRPISTSAIRTRSTSPQVREFVDNAARAAALATGTKVKIDNYGSMRDGISVATLSEVGFAHMKHFGATRSRRRRASRRAMKRRAASPARSPGWVRGITSNAPTTRTRWRRTR